MLTQLTTLLQLAPAASQRPVPTPHCHIPSAGLLHNEASTEVQAIHPSGLPLACGIRMERTPLGFPPMLRTPPLPATHVKGGDRLRALARNYAVDIADPPIRESTRNVRPRVAQSAGAFPMMSSATSVRARRRSALLSWARNRAISGPKTFR
jgi:hypothetical protein